MNLTFRYHIYFLPCPSLHVRQAKLLGSWPGLLPLQWPLAQHGGVGLGLCPGHRPRRQRWHCVQDSLEISEISPN
jgi:hypothetical protein